MTSNQIVNVLVNGVNLVAYVEWSGDQRTIIYKHYDVTGKAIFNDYIECENEEAYIRKISQFFSRHQLKKNH